MIRILAGIFLIFSIVATAETVTPQTVNVGNAQYSLNEQGVLTVSSPDLGRPLVIESGSPIAHLVPLEGRMFVEDIYHRGFYLSLPEGKGGFISRQLVRMLNSEGGGNLFRGKWAEAYHWDLLDLHGMMNIHGEKRHVVRHQTIQREDGTDIILETFENRFSMRKLLQELDASGASKRSVCDKILLGLPR